MPILAMDKNGKIYQTSRDRADGRGYGSSPECVDEGDVTLGSAYLSAQDRRRDELIRERGLREREDQMNLQAEHNASLRRRRARMHATAEEKLLENPIIQANLLRRAAMNGCDCEAGTSMSGNAFTANGRGGWDGMSRDQQAIHHAVTGMGRDVAFAVDPVEAAQYRMRADAARILGRRR